MTTPSFSSFPTSFSSFPDLDAGQSEPEKKKESSKKHRHESKRDKSKHKDKGKDKEHKEKKRDHRVEEEAQDVYSSQRFFYSDRKGDPLNVEYGKLHRGDIPRYNDRYSKKILGLSQEWTIFHRNDKGIQVGKGHRKEVTDLASKEARRLLSEPSTRRIRGNDKTDKYQEVDGYIRLTSGLKSEETTAYRSITREEDNSDSDASSSKSDHEGPDSSDDESEDYVLTSEQEALKSLEQQLSADPTSIDNWLQLLSRTLSTVDPASKNATKARSEITLSVLSRALRADPQNSASTTLRLKYLRAGANVWEQDKLHSEWENALKLGDVDVWLEWLEWRISVGKEGIDGVFDAARRVMSSLGDSEEEEMAKLRVFWRVAVACQQAGYTERATAMFQAQAELTFEMSQSFCGLPLEACLVAFEEFWESEAPRVGEEGSKGWSRWNPQDQIMVASTSTQIQSIQDHNSDPYQTWAQEESLADQTRRLPLRTMDEASDSDPYAAVMFADIKDVLFALQSLRAKDVFRLAWLSLLGLPVPGISTLMYSNGSSWDDRWSLLHLSSPSFIGSIFPPAEGKRALTVDSVAGVLVGRQKEYAISFGPMKHWSWGVMQSLDPLFGSVGLWSKVDVTDLDQGLVSRVFSQLRLGEDDVEWDVLALAFSAATSVKRQVAPD
ncbi:hypothetical protein VKT23_003263 [Stygiomarasmius scandens]|uniref:Uncharacterized protein n=1 Tax=Marasmiellus scandens TaxID=2682957 RepID=A0ABR1JWP5_9AGAR